MDTGVSRAGYGRAGIASGGSSAVELDLTGRTRAAGGSRTALDVVVTCGRAEAATELAAFDAALQQAGVAHLNLIRLSSLVPPGSRVLAPPEWQQLPGGWGDRLYAVYAEHRVSTAGRRACAGLGWVQDEDTAAGVLVEHHGCDEASVQARISATLDDLKARRPARWGANAWRTTSTECSGRPVAAVVVAAFRVEPW